MLNVCRDAKKERAIQLSYAQYYNTSSYVLPWYHIPSILYVQQLDGLPDMAL